MRLAETFEASSIIDTNLEQGGRQSITSLSTNVVQDFTTATNRVWKLLNDPGYAEAVEQYKGRQGEPIPLESKQELEAKIAHEKAQITMWQTHVNTMKGDSMVENLEALKAAGLCEMATRTVVFDTDGFRLKEVQTNGRYRKYVAYHEYIHKYEQAESYDASSLTYYTNDAAITINLLALIEGHAIIRSGQPDTDLPPLYQLYKTETLLFLQRSGMSVSQFNSMMKSGEVQAVQEHLDKQNPEMANIFWLTGNTRRKLGAN